MSYRINLFGDEGLKIIASGLQSLYNVETMSLNLDENNISDEGISVLMKTVSKIQSLEKLHIILQSNPFTE